MTYATDKGFVIGQQYRVNPDSYMAGTLVTFLRDDGTMSPAFTVPYEYDSSGWAYIYLGRLEPLVLPSVAVTAQAETPQPLKNYIIDVSDVETAVKVGKLLSADQIKRIIDILGE